MLDSVVTIFVYLGSALMIYNIYGFIRFARTVRKSEGWDQRNAILYIPVILLIFFFLGYIGIAAFGDPDILTASILFGGSIFVFVIYQLLNVINKRMKEKEKQAARLLAEQESSRIKTGFLATISHEMRTPMNVILGLSELAQRNPNLPEETRDYLQRISQSGEHLLQMIVNILDLNSMEEGNLEVTNRAFSMERMLMRVDGVAEYLCEEKGLTLQTDTDESIHRWYLSDEAMIEQVLLAIISNAVKYTDPPGTVCLSMKETGCREKEHVIQFSVADTGIGIDESFLPRIYEIFAKEDSGSTSSYGGSGIGLAVTKRKADLLGGTIEVQSRKGEGTVFTVTIPLTEAEDPALKAPKAQEADPAGIREAAGEAAPASEGVLEGKRILIVEDIPDNAEIVADLLAIEGAETEHAQNGQIALDMFREAPLYYYDAVLMDLRMPVMDGLEATRRIRKLERDDAAVTPILALTANAFESDVQKSLAAGMNAHLAKPTDSDQLYAALIGYMREAEKTAGREKK